MSINSKGCLYANFEDVNWKTVQSFLKKLKLESPYHPAISLVGMYGGGNEISASE